MLDDIAKDAKVLSNAKAGWVTRRDAAERLGSAAELALKALQANRADTDVDVRPSIDKALASAKARLENVSASHHTLKELAEFCAKPGERIVTCRGDSCEVEVHIKDKRRQTVYLSKDTGKDGAALVRVLTRCGPPSPKSLEWALKLNMQLARGALALQGDGTEQCLVLTHSIPADTATPEEVKTAVKEAAFYGDWIESKLAEKDEL